MLPRGAMKIVAQALQLTPTDKIDVKRSPNGIGWMLCGCLEANKPLPQTSGCNTITEALKATMAWLAPEIDALDK